MTSVIVRRSIFRTYQRAFQTSMLLAAATALTGDETWRQAQAGYVFKFPRDHASHPEYKIEWWYYIGNLTSREGQRFGYQLTFFRIGIDPQPKNPSRWTIRDLYMTHFAITDVAERKYLFTD